MNCRRYGSKPTIAFWMLVAAGDAALLVTSIGLVTVLLALGAVVTVAVVVVGAWSLRRGTIRPRRVAGPAVTLHGRRRA